MFLIILLLWALEGSEAARCAPGLPGDCPVLQNVTAGDAVCPLGGIRMFCPNNTLAPVYSCAAMGPAGPPPSVQQLAVNSSQCALGGALIVGTASNASLCNVAGPTGPTGPQGVKGDVGPAFKLDFVGAVTDATFNATANTLLHDICANNSLEDYMAVVAADLRTNKNYPVFQGNITITDVSFYLVVYQCNTAVWSAVVIRGPQGIQGIQGIQGVIGPVPRTFSIDAACLAVEGANGNVSICGPQGLQGIQGIQGLVGPLPRIFPNGTACASFEGATGNITLCGPQGIQGLQGLRGEVGPVFQPHFHGAVNDSYFNLTLNTLIAQHCASDPTHIHVSIVTEDLRLDKSKPVFEGGVTIADLTRYLVIFDCEDLTWDAIGDFLGEQGPPPTITNLGGGCISVVGVGSEVICNITGPMGLQGIQGIQGIQGNPPTITNIGSGCISITGTGTAVICNVTGPTGATGATGQAGTNATVSWGNMVLVDSIFGSDSTGARQGLPFRTIAAALAVAQSGDVVQVRPGTYNETSLTVPPGVTLAGLARDRCIINPSGFITTFNSVPVTLSANSILRDMTITVTSTVHAKLYAVDKSSSGSKVERVTIALDTTGAPSGGTADIFGIFYNGSTIATPEDIGVMDVRISVRAYDFGRKRCYHQEGSGGQYIQLMTCIVYPPLQLRANGTFIGVETAGPNLPVVYLLNSDISGYTADISQTSGRIVLKDTTLVNSNANSLGFDSRTSLPTFQMSDNGGLTAGSTRFYILGTVSLGTTERWVNMPGSCLVTNLTITASPGPGASRTDTWTVRRSIGQAGTFTNTPVAVSLTAAATSGYSSGVSQHYDKDDRLSVQVALVTGTTTSQTRVTVAYLCQG